MISVPYELNERNECIYNLITEECLIEFAKITAPLLNIGDIITLTGDLGAGKTSCARALIRALTDDDLLQVPSPSFNILQLYEAKKIPIVHIDLYRIEDVNELIELDIDSALSGAISVIEWPERWPALKGGEYVDIKIEIPSSSNHDRRQITLSGSGSLFSRISQEWSILFLLNVNGWQNAERIPIAGDASARRFERLKLDDQSRILMISPLNYNLPNLFEQFSYRSIAKLSNSVGSFVAISTELRSQGFSSPKILNYDLKQGIVIAEDLGNEGITHSSEPIHERYFEATNLLVMLHTTSLPIKIDLDATASHTLPPYDMEALIIEVSLFLDWYIPYITNGNALNYQRQEFQVIWQRLLSTCCSNDLTWTLRDFHSPNLLWLPERVGIRRIGLIDIQDAVLGNAAYDLGSLLQDARVPITESFQNELYNFYIENRKKLDVNFEANYFRNAYSILSMQRVLKVLGIFVRLLQRDKKGEYIKYLPILEKYIKQNLIRSELGELRNWFCKYYPQIIGN